MIFFGWGSKQRDIAIDARTHVIVVRSFVHIMFLFTVTWGRKFLLAQLGDQGWGQRVISAPEAAALNGGVVPDINPWWRFSLLGLIGLGIVSSVMSSIT